MSPKDGKSVKAKTGADLRAQAEARLSAQAGPKAEASHRADVIRAGLSGYATTMDKIAEAYRREDWKALGYESFNAYAGGEFGEARLKLTPEQRAQILPAFLAVGMSKRGAAAALGVDDKTIRNDLRGADNSAPKKKSPLVNAMRQAIEEAQTAAGEPNTSADGGDTPEPSMPPVPPASGPSASLSADGPDVTPEDPEGSAGESLPSERSAGHAAATAPASDPSADTPAAERSPTPHSALVAEQPGPNVHIESRFAPKGAPGCFSAGGDRPQERLSDITCPVCRGWLAGDGADFVDRWRRGGALLEDSSPEASEASPQGEASAGGTVIPSPEEGPAVATPVEPRIDHPFVGEAPTPPSAAGVEPSPVAGVFVGGDEVEGEAGPSSSTDPAAIVSDFEAFVRRVDDTYDADVAGPLCTEGQMAALHTAVDDLAQFVGLLERWRNS